MTSRSFDRAVANVLKNEGGLVDNPNDPGGLTNFGISQRAYPHLDVRQLTAEEATNIYQRAYWVPIKGDSLPGPLGFALLDFAVNSGVNEAVKALQRAMGLTADGVMGPQTIAIAQRPGAVTALSVERIMFLIKLKDFPTFGNGWITRVINTALGAFE